ncbi:MAG TPA: molybdopterin dinucleotide binding domain-containing protein [Candidatus Methylomirabilis sp.]|nr:molybdopterin dinucleotide binding domain-containing protein [Candidatus Methylomirabilis sp.]
MIPGRSTQQGTSLNDKSSPEYREVTRTLRMNPDDMKRLGVGEGTLVKMRNAQAEIEVTCVSAKDELPLGVLFMAYGPESSKLMGGETHGTGMPDSKGIEVEVAMAERPKAGGGQENDGG